MHAKRQIILPVTICGLALGLIGCTTSPDSEPTTYRVEARGDTLSQAHSHALEKARQQCQSSEPVVLTSQTRDTEPTFDTDSQLPAGQSEGANEAAATQEGERPLIAWEYRCK